MSVLTFVYLLAFFLPCILTLGFMGSSVRLLQQLSKTGKNRIHDTPITYESRFFTQRLDHFNFHVTPTTFQQRYLINTNAALSQGGVLDPMTPVLFYTGNEGDITLFAENTGFMFELAVELNAIVLFAEHRYYGVSLPFGNESFSAGNIGFLSVTQALEDYSELLFSVKKELGVSNAAVISFGGSYGGMLSAWFRMKYPNVVAGAIAASAPIYQFANWTAPEVFNHLVTLDFAAQILNVSPTLVTCADIWVDIFSTLQNLLSSDIGRMIVETELQLCEPLNVTTALDDVNDWLIGTVGYQAMGDYPFASSFLEPDTPPFVVNASCSVLGSCFMTAGADPKAKMQCLNAGLSLYFNGSGTVTCNDIGSSTSGALGADTWDYQTCTEMAMPQSQLGPPNDMFPVLAFDYNDYAASCMNTWGVIPEWNWVKIEMGRPTKGIHSNIVFSQGLLDPWRGGGVMETISDSLVSILIPEGAHHLDLRSSHVGDPIYVTAARALEKKFVVQWINEWNSMQASK